MTQILRDPTGKTTSIFADGTRPIDMSKDHGIYTESIVFHTLQHGLMAKYADGSIVNIAPTYAMAAIPSERKITIHIRSNVDGNMLIHQGSEDFNKFRVISIPESSVAEGPFWCAELNAVLFVPQHEEFAVHPGDMNAVNAFIDNRVSDRLQRTGHSGVTISITDWQARFPVLYTELHGRIVAIPAQHFKPTDEELRLIHQGRLIADLDPEGNPVSPYDRIRITYILDHQMHHHDSGSVDTASYSITNLMRKSATSWKLGGQWFATSPAELKHRLAEEHGPDIQIGYTKEALDDAIHFATRNVATENEMLKTELETAHERNKRLEAALKDVRDLPKKVALGAYDLSDLNLTMRKHLDDTQTARIKATAIAAKASRDAESAHSSERAKTKAAIWDAVGHLAKFATVALPIAIGVAAGNSKKK